MKRLACIEKSCTVIALLANGYLSVGFAQSVSRFEVASIRPSNGESSRSSGGPGTGSPERFAASNVPLSDLVRWAYDVSAYAFKAPDWSRSARFDVEAKIPPGASREQFRLMLQDLLIERFGLKAHYEKQQMRVYTLTISKGGPKLKKSIPKTADSSSVADRSYVIANKDRSVIRAVNEPIGYLAVQLSSLFDLPVTDTTGLTEKYDFTVSWKPDLSIADSMDPSIHSSVFSALEQELGLKLEPARAPVDMLVVDHIERVPTDN